MKDDIHFGTCIKNLGQSPNALIIFGPSSQKKKAHKFIKLKINSKKFLILMISIQIRK